MPDHEALSECLRWLRYAKEDLHSAETLAAQQSVAPRHVCWFAQQAAEKAIKAGLVYLQIDFPKLHDLEALRGLLPPDWRLRSESLDLEELTEWSVEARYPGTWPDATARDAAQSVEEAQRVYALISEDLAMHGVRT